MAGDIHMGYMGYADINGTVMKITGSSLNPVQNINAPMLVQGSYLRKAWNYGPVEVGGNVTGPAGQQTFESLWELGEERNSSKSDRLAEESITVDLQYVQSTATGSTTDNRRRFTGCSINTMTISVTAGDVATFTIEFFGGSNDWGASSSFGVDVDSGGTPGAVICERLITWDQCLATIPGSMNMAQETLESWDVTLNNNLSRIYSLGQDNYFPIQILAGIKEVNGTFGVYAPNAPLDPQGTAPYFGADQYGDYVGDVSASTIQFAVGGVDLFPTSSISIVTARTEAAATTGPAIYTVRWEGVCNY